MLQKIFVGIDWADKKHDVCIADSEGRILDEFVISNDTAGFTKFDTKLTQYAKEQLYVCIETNHGLLFDHLIEFNYPLYPVNPGALVDFRLKHSLARSKNDKLDARLLADYVRQNLRDLRVHIMNNETTQLIKVLTEDRQRLLKHKVRLENQLIDTLKLYYPAALEIFGEVANSISLNFIERYPTPEKARQLSLDNIKTFLKNESYCKPQRAEEIVEILQKDQPRAPRPFVQAKEIFVKAAVPQIRSLVEQIKVYDKEIKKYFTQHPDNQIFTSLPGAGDNIGPRLLSCFGDDRNRFPKFNNVQCLAGTAPVTERSGKYQLVKFRFACNKFFRATMRDLAFTSLQQSDWARSFYDRQREKGRTNSEALRALGNKWLKVIHYLWITKTEYDENVHLAKVARSSLKMACV